MRRAWLLAILFVAGCHRGPANDTYAVYEAVLPEGRPCVVRESANGGFDPVGRLYLEGLALMGSLAPGSPARRHSRVDNSRAKARVRVFHPS